ncbi:MAG: VC0807 family protein [Pseudomonadales bacterium]
MSNNVTNTQDPKRTPQRENLLLNILLNIVIPTIILTRFSGEDRLGPQLGIIIALAFPIAYGVRDYFRAYKINFFSALGVVSVTLTGGMSLLELDPQYIAIKEAAIPAIFGLATLISLKTRYPLVRTFL